MSNQAVMASPQRKLLVLSQPEFEQDIESRLRRLGRLVKDLAGSAYPLLVIETARIRVGLGELVVKEEAMRWILGVAKHSDGAVQRKLLAHITEALSELEKTAESLLYAECT